jgi:hypothetical protein
MSHLRAVTVPFRNADEAWAWAWDALLLARLGLPARRGAAHPPRPCTPAMLISLGITCTTPLPVLAVLARHGQLGYPPEPGSEGAAIWRAAMHEVETALQSRGWLADAERCHGTRIAR